jgi:hypothetical protein
MSSYLAYGISEPAPPSYVEDQSEPPSYVSGSSVEVATCDDSLYCSVLQISLTPSVSGPVRETVFDTSDLITGKVLVTPKRDMAFEHLIVDLLGQEITVRKNSFSESQYKRLFTLAKYDIPRQTLPDDNLLRKGFKYSFTFSLVLPETVAHDSCPCSDQNHDELPPSFGTALDAFDPTFGRQEFVPDGSARVIYRIRARLFKTDTSSGCSVWAQTCKYITVRPSSYPLLDLSKLYDSDGVSLRQESYNISKRLSHGLVRKSDMGTIRLQTENQLNFLLANPATTTLKLKVNYSPSEKRFIPPEISGISYCINALTFSCTETIKHPPSLRTVQKHRNIHMVVEQLIHQKLTIAKPIWELQPTPEGASEVTTLVVPVSFPVLHEKVIATYFSCLTSRQYEMVVTVHLRGLGSITLSVPILVSNFRPRQVSVSSSTCDEETLSMRLEDSSSSSVTEPSPSYEQSLGPTMSGSTVATPQDQPGAGGSDGNIRSKLHRTFEQTALLLAIL